MPCKSGLFLCFIVCGLINIQSAAYAVSERGYNAPRIPLSVYLEEESPLRSAEYYVNVLRDYPGRRIEVTLKTATETRTMVEDIKAIAARKGINIRNRLCFSARVDVVKKFDYSHHSCQPSLGGDGCDWEPAYMDGSFKEPSTAKTIKVSHKDTGRGYLKSSRVFKVPAANWVEDQWVGRKFNFKPRTPFAQSARIRRNTTNQLVFEDPLLVDIPFTKTRSDGETVTRTRNFIDKDASFKILGSFDTDWIMRVPKTIHNQDMTRFWYNNRNVCGETHDQPCDPPLEPLDPFDPGNNRSWADWVDKQAIFNLIDDTTLPMFWGKPGDVDRDVNIARDEEAQAQGFTDPFIFFGAVVLDLRHPAARTWQARKTLSRAKAYGFDKKDGLCVRIPYKPGIHNFHDEATLGVGRRSVPGTNMDVDPVHIRADGTSHGGTIDRTQYGAGEFGAAMNAYMLELISTAKSFGYNDLQILTEEGPQYTHSWYLLSFDVIRRSEMAGEAESAPINTQWPPPGLDQPLSKNEWPD